MNALALVYELSSEYSGLGVGIRWFRVLFLGTVGLWSEM
jgi:hypothetical protein